ncbi:CHRD domain-containing protein [Arenibacter sp. F26102]|uniref:CHRD domain-containing protein n=1 Tax=Arenibacter sp. F26102 TaxID=2926416 RepID=UPI001FF606F9|nr:CHRD domain-containing protein [Arenibacter sp. F26102]MCK0145453.1 CHRD domain-containing protein [Arenibacter sp. F26102]
MKKIINFSMGFLGLLALILLCGGCSSDVVFEPTEQIYPLSVKSKMGETFNFTTSLKGRNEVPAVPSDAAGHVSIKINKDETEIHYKITAANIENVRAAHFHVAPMGSNGGVVAFLYSNTNQPSGPQNGVLVEGIITADDLINSMLGQPLSNLIDEIRAGNIYVNVHTSQYPGGEIRGQL